MKHDRRSVGEGERWIIQFPQPDLPDGRGIERLGKQGEQV